MTYTSGLKSSSANIANSPGRGLLLLKIPESSSNDIGRVFSPYRNCLESLRSCLIAVFSHSQTVATLHTHAHTDWSFAFGETCNTITPSPSITSLLSLLLIVVLPSFLRQFPPSQSYAWTCKHLLHGSFSPQAHNKQIVFTSCLSQISVKASPAWSKDQDEKK